ncbi:MAG TPA: efflux RND transporter permease subunit [Usitatibacter sp.]|nr:efflux RND transporter permease subunit [Usitatibacter sp.]
MNAPAWFIQRPVATLLLMLGILAVGITAAVQLPIAGVPQVDIPTISVSTSLPGAGAEMMAASVTAPLERALATLPGVVDISSTSSLGSSSITVEFDLARSVDSAAVDVQTAINTALSDLPKSLPHPPTFEKRNPTDALLMTVAVYSDGLPIAAVDDLAENILAPEIARVPGVGLVDYHGRQKPAVRVQVDPARAASMGLTLEDVRQRIVEATANGAKGTLDDARRSVALDANDQLTRASEFGAITLVGRAGTTTSLRDIAHAIDGVEDAKVGAWTAHHQAVMIDVHKQIGFNLNETVQRVRALIPDLERKLPGSVHLVLLGDRTQAIRASVRDVLFTLLATCALVVVVVFAFLGTLRATLIPALAIPLSIVGTMAVMSAMGYTLDNVSLMALTVSVGFVVDDAIVMVENVMRHVEAGESPMAAALAGSREIGFTIVSMTLSLVAVFIPLIFMGGIVGRLFHEFGNTAAIAILISGAISLSLTPMLCARLLRPPSRDPSAHEGRSSAWYRSAIDHYGRSIDWVLRHEPLMLLVVAGGVAASVLLYVYIPKGFFPQQDNGLIAGVTEAPVDISFPAMAARMHEVADRVVQDKDVQAVYYWVEGDPSLNVGRVLIDLKPFGERKSSVYQVMDRLRSRASGVAGMELRMQARQDVTIGTRVSKTQFQYTLRDADLVELRKWTPRMLALLESIPQLRDVAGDIEPAGPQLRIVMDRDAMGRLGVTAQSVDDVLYDAFGQRQVASYYTQVNVYRVVLEVDPALGLDERAFDVLHVPSRNGGVVPLKAFCSLERSSAPVTVSHDGQFPAVTLSFNLAPGTSLGEAVSAIQARERTSGMPAGLTSSFTGSARAFQESLATQPLLIAASLLAIFIVLGILYESFAHPLTIMSTLPTAGIGGLLALLATGHEFSLIALIGMILLIGIVKKNGIMMVDVAIAQRALGKSPEEAVRHAALLRFRPIMMTTLAALFGALPLAIGTGAGSELRRPLGIAIVGGLLLSQALTLFTTPVVYVYMERMRERTRALRRRLAAWRGDGTAPHESGHERERKEGER